MIINCSLSKKNIFLQKNQSIVFFLPENFQQKDLNENFKNFDFNVAYYLKEIIFTGAKDSFASFPLQQEKNFIHLFFVGIGKQNDSKNFSIETMRRAIGSAIKAAKAKKIESISFALPSSSLFGMSAELFLQEMYIIASIAAYKFDVFLSKKDKKETKLDITLFVDTSDQKAIKKAEQNGSIIAQAVNQARYHIDLPANKLTPHELAQEAKKLAEKHHLKCTIFDEKKIKEIGLNGIAGVSAGSHQDAQFVILEYKTKTPHAATIGFVGKGITFDSGGLSIKPAASMENMKEDMAGAASVIQALGAIAQLKPNVNVIGFVAITENMPGCSAQKPGDIVTFYNGKTAEIRNTDAEGRLILADALSYAVKHFKLDSIVDVATLTGACIYAVGPFFSALLSDNQNLADKIKTSAQQSGDYVWQLPFTQDFRAAIKSDIADIQNVGDPRIAAGTITAAWFLKEFSGDVPWAHLDIASSAYNVPNISYFEKGATGSSVRLLINLAMNWEK
ncbi:leucyl aminopeptidase [Candidatus Dependentiae bacterium]|nr:leucyl aminopeptidase [Candidatus Dependentiae bacterium]